jgi:hypothetical protein
MIKARENRFQDPKRRQIILYYEKLKPKEQWIRENKNTQEIEIE